MKRQAVVIGLGQFGMAVARALSEQDTEVFAADLNEARVRAASVFAAEAAVVDAMDEEALARTTPSRRDFCLCAIGDEAKDASIICTALLRELGAKRVIARANDDLHARILTSVGAHMVVNPEREYGERFANRLLHEEIQGEMALGDGLWVTEVSVPKAFVGHALKDLQLPVRYGVSVVAIRKGSTGVVALPDGSSAAEEGDVFVVVARSGAVGKMVERS